MCVYCIGSHASLRCTSSHGSAQIALCSGATKTKSISNPPELNTVQGIPATAPRFPSDPDTHITLTQHTLNPDNMVQPPDDVIDHWFHRLGLSLDTPLGILSDVPNLSPSVSVLDDIGLSVSSILVILRHIQWYSRLAHTVKRGSLLISIL